MQIKKFIRDNKVEIGCALAVATTTIIGLTLLNKVHENALRNILNGSKLVVRLDNTEVAKDILSGMNELLK